MMCKDSNMLWTHLDKTKPQPTQAGVFLRGQLL